MDSLTLLTEAQAAGLTVLADGERLVVRGPRSAEAVARMLLAHKHAVLTALAAEREEFPRNRVSAFPRSEHDPPATDERAASWPPVCLEAEQRFGQRHARLFPLIGQRVSTPHGAGVLCQVFRDRAAVVVGTDPLRLAALRHDEAPALTFVAPEHVAPLRAEYR